MFLLTFVVTAGGCAIDDVRQEAKRELLAPDIGHYAAIGGERFPVVAVNPRRLNPKYLRQDVNYETSEPPGTLVVDPRNYFLYLVLREGRALRYGIGVGREGFGWSGSATILHKAEWPKWTPPPEMVTRDPKAAPWIKGMPGGPENPLGARALYLFQNGRDTLYRIHGTGEAQSIGKAVSSGCIRLLNQDIIDLYRRVPIGSRVVVLTAPSPPPTDVAGPTSEGKPKG